MNTILNPLFAVMYEIGRVKYLSTALFVGIWSMSTALILEDTWTSWAIAAAVIAATATTCILLVVVMWKFTEAYHKYKDMRNEQKEQ